ncbi:MAG: hypothetical protein K2J14_08210, partial [Treponemataceae bacterium]|nr:hypothetical protein [Treponemataceae bacterium]
MQPRALQSPASSDQDSLILAYLFSYYYNTIMRRFLQVFCPFFSGVALALAIPIGLLPFGAPLIALFSLLPFYVALSRAKSYASAFVSGWILAFTAHMLS